MRRGREENQRGQRLETTKDQNREEEIQYQDPWTRVDCVIPMSYSNAVDKKAIVNKHDLVAQA